MKLGAVVGAAWFNEAHFLAQDFSTVVAADGGFAHLQRACARIDHVVGDFDSLGYVPNHSSVETHSSRKDETDLELALRYAQSCGCDTLFVYGCLGGRLDHSCATLQLLAAYAERGLRVFAVGESEVVCALSGAGHRELVFSTTSTPKFAALHGTVSVFAAGGPAYGVSERGLSYEVEACTLYPTRPLGISNELIGAPARISVEEGTLLVFFPVSVQPFAFMQ